jgi:hypothetical protein
VQVAVDLELTTPAGAARVLKSWDEAEAEPTAEKGLLEPLVGGGCQ